jgi:hypothetical protein
MGDINHRETFQYQILPIRKFTNSKNEVFFYALTIGFLCMILLYAFGNSVYNLIVWQILEQFKA